MSPYNVLYPTAASLLLLEFNHIAPYWLEYAISNKALSLGCIFSSVNPVGGVSHCAWRVPITALKPSSMGKI